MEGGKPERLTGAVVEKIVKEYSEYLESVKKDALSLLDDGYKKLRAETTSKLEELFASYNDSLKSLESSLDLQVRLHAQKRRNEILEEAVSKARDRIFGMSEREKEKLYASALKKILEASPRGRVELHIESQERKVFEKILKKISADREIDLKTDLPEESGGFILVFSESGISQDYTLKRTFELMKDELMSVAKKSIFEED